MNQNEQKPQDNSTQERDTRLKQLILLRAKVQNKRPLEVIREMKAEMDELKASQGEHNEE
jgi:hypothetical protein